METNGHVCKELIAGFQAFVVDAPRRFDDDPQAGVGRGASDKVFGDVHGLEHDAAQGTSHVAEHAMFDGVVLRATGRIVGHADRQAQVAGQVQQFFIEEVLPIAVVAAAIAQQQQRSLCAVMIPLAQPLPPATNGVAGQGAGVRTDRQQHQPFIECDIVHAVGNQAPLVLRGEIVVQDPHARWCMPGPGAGNSPAILYVWCRCSARRVIGTERVNDFETLTFGI